MHLCTQDLHVNKYQLKVQVGQAWILIHKKQPVDLRLLFVVEVTHRVCIVNFVYSHRTHILSKHHGMRLRAAINANMIVLRLQVYLAADISCLEALGESKLQVYAELDIPTPNIYPQSSFVSVKGG